jgi:hypothetical protein
MAKLPGFEKVVFHGNAKSRQSGGKRTAPFHRGESFAVQSLDIGLAPRQTLSVHGSSLVRQAGHDLDFSGVSADDN